MLWYSCYDKESFSILLVRKARKSIHLLCEISKLRILPNGRKMLNKKKARREKRKKEGKKDGRLRDLV
jgi:hypothetical protein